MQKQHSSKLKQNTFTGSYVATVIVLMLKNTAIYKAVVRATVATVLAVPLFIQYIAKLCILFCDITIQF